MQMEQSPHRTITLGPDITPERLAANGFAIIEGKLAITAGPSRGTSFDSGIGNDDVTVDNSGEAMDVDGDLGETPHHQPEFPTGSLTAHPLAQTREKSQRVTALEEENSTLETEITRLLRETQELLDRNAALEARNTALETKARTSLPRFLTENHARRNHVEELESNVTQFRADHVELQESTTEIHDLHAALIDSTEKIDRQAHQIQLLQQENRGLSDEVDELALQLNASAAPPSPLPTCWCYVLEHYRTIYSAPPVVPSRLRYFWTMPPSLVPCAPDWPPDVDVDISIHTNQLSCPPGHLDSRPLPVRRLVENFRKYW